MLWTNTQSQKEIQHINVCDQVALLLMTPKINVLSPVKRGGLMLRRKGMGLPILFQANEGIPSLLTATSTGE